MHRRRTALIAAGVLALAVPTAAHSAPTDPNDRFEKVDGPTLVNSSFVPASVDGATRVQVMVELAGDPVAVAEAKAGRDLSPAEQAKLRRQLKAKQDALKSKISARGGKVLS